MLFRSQLDDIADAHEARKAKEAEKKRKQKEQEQLEMGLLIGGICLVLFLVYVGIYEMLDHCARARCGR